MCRYMLHTAEQHSAAKRLQKWERFTGRYEHEREQLVQGANSEAQVNATEFDMSLGNAVVFGNIYQLLNTHSNHFLAIERRVAEESQSAMRVALQSRALRTK